MTNREIITNQVNQDKDYFIQEDIQSGTVIIEVSLDWWNSEYKENKE